MISSPDPINGRANYVEQKLLVCDFDRFGSQPSVFSWRGRYVLLAAISLCCAAVLYKVCRSWQPHLTANAVVLGVGHSQTYTHLIVIHGIIAWLDAYGLGEHRSCCSALSCQWQTNCCGSWPVAVSQLEQTYCGIFVVQNSARMITCLNC
jgi:hypothetical protein